MSESPAEFRLPSRPLDRDAEREFLAHIYFALDGQWFLKVRDAVGDEAARDLNEHMCAALARIQLRAFLRLTGFDGVRDARDLGRFVVAIHDALYGDYTTAFEITVDTPDVFEIKYTSCQIWDMGNRAGYAEEAEPGDLPGCAGILAMASGWAAAAGNYVLERNPGLRDGNVACVYRFVQMKA